MFYEREVSTFEVYLIRVRFCVMYFMTVCVSLAVSRLRVESAMICLHILGTYLMDCVGVRILW